MKKISALFTLILLTNFSMAQKYRPELSITSISDSLFKNAVAIVRYDHKEFDCFSNGQAKLHNEFAVTILNRNGERHYNNLILKYNKLIVINKLKRSVYDAFGRRVEGATLGDVTDYSYISNGSFYEDNRAKSIEINYNDYPYTIIFKYTYTLKDYLEIPDWYPMRHYNTSIESSYFKLNVPLDDSVKYTMVNANADPIITKQQNSIEYIWHLNNLLAIDYEPYSPDFSLVSPRLMISSYNIIYGNYHGENNSWEQFGQFIFDLNTGLQELPESAIWRINELTNYCKTDYEKIRVLYEELQNTTRYVNISLGIGGLKSYEAEYVYNNKYGDCKALTNYMHSMLLYCGIESYWVLVSAGTGIPDIDTEFSSSQFNHVILAIPHKTDTIWLECTSQELPFNYLGSFTGNRHALLLTPEGGKLVKTPNYFAHDNRLITTANVLIDNEGIALAETEFLSTGSQSRKYEHVYRSYTNEEKEEWLYAQFDLPSFKIISYKFSEPAPDSAAILLDLKTELSHFITKSGRRFFLNPNMYSNYIEVPKSVTDRKLRIVRNTGYMDTDSIVYRIPDEYKIEALPDILVDIKSDFGHYIAKLEYVKSEHTIIYIRTLIMNRFNKSADQYIVLRNFYKDIVKADNRKIILVHK